MSSHGSRPGAGAAPVDLPDVVFLSSAQIINFREPVTLDFLDAELEDSSKEEVKHAETSVKMV